MSAEDLTPCLQIHRVSARRDSRLYDLQRGGDAHRKTVRGKPVQRAYHSELMLLLDNAFHIMIMLYVMLV